MKRVLRPGGRLLVADFMAPERGLWHIVAMLTGHTAGSEMVRRVSPLKPFGRLSPVPRSPVRRRSAVAALRSCDPPLSEWPVCRGVIGVSN